MQKDAQGQLQSHIDNYQERHMKKDKWTTDVAKARFVSIIFKSLSYINKYLIC